MNIDGFKVFSATKHADRLALGNLVTEWLSKEKVDIVNKWVMQSSDREFHCVSIILANKLPKR